MRSDKLRKYVIGDKAFYRMVLVIVIPIIVQNAITNFVSLLDNIMVGQVGTAQMSGVSIANQLLLIFNLSVYGGVSGAGIFVSQFYGAKNLEGVRRCFRYKMILCAVLVAAALVGYSVFGKTLLSLYLTGEGTAEEAEITLKYGLDYLHIMFFGLIPFAMTQVYAGTLRETGETKLPMRASVAAVFVNLTFNYLLIYGKFGFPMLGVQGAAIATVLSRFVELGIIMIAVHKNKQRHPFIEGVYRGLYIPRALAKDIFIKGTPLMVNELIWSTGMATLTQCYSVRGLNVIAAMNISSTFSNLFSVVLMAMGGATSIVLGHALGAGETEKARVESWQLLWFSVFTCFGLMAVLFFAAPALTLLYQTETDVRTLAASFMRVYAVCMPLVSVANSCYFTLRSGGKTVVTFIFDAGYTWIVACPVAWLLVHFTNLPVLTIYLFVCLCDFIKCLFGCTLMKKGIWIHNMVENVD